MGAASDRRARQKASLRQEILDAARTLFAREGVESVSIRKIAERVEYSPGAIYLHFRDKAEILQTLCNETFARLHQSLQAIHDDRSDTLDSLRRGMRGYIEFGLQNPHHYLVTFVYAASFLHEHGRHPDPSDPGFGCFDKFRGIVRKCIEEGLFRLDDVEEVSQTLWAGMHGITTLLITKPGFPFVERSRLVDRVVDVLIQGVRRQ
jgi:AcrR family transcriptional regulator